MSINYFNFVLIRKTLKNKIMIDNNIYTYISKYFNGNIKNSQKHISNVNVKLNYLF